MSFEQVLIVELIGVVKWLAVGVLLITFAGNVFKRVLDQAVKSVGEQSKEFVDYLIKDLDKPKG